MSILLGQRGLEARGALAFLEGHCMASTSPGTSQGGLGARFNQQPSAQEMLMSFLGCAFPVVFSILLLECQSWCPTLLKQNLSFLTPAFPPLGFSFPQAPGW